MKNQKLNQKNIQNNQSSQENKGWTLPPKIEWDFDPNTGEPVGKERIKSWFKMWQTWVIIVLAFLVILSFGIANEPTPQEYRRLRTLQNEAIRKEIKTKDQIEWQKIDKQRIVLLEKLNKINVQREAIELRVKEKRKIIECNSKLWDFSNKFNTAKFNEKEVCETKKTKVSKQGGDDLQNQIVQYAYDISKGNTRFVYMLEAESGVRNIQSNVRDSNGKREPSFGYCQIHASYHKDIVNSPKFKDWKWQIDKCWELYQKGTVFYASMDRDLMSRAKQNIQFEEVKI